jgi:hypothetical protein
VFVLRYDAWNWEPYGAAKISTERDGVRITARAGTYDRLMTTEPFTTTPGGLYALEYDVDVAGGTVALFPISAETDVITSRPVAGQGAERWLFRARSGKTRIEFRHWNPESPRSSSTLIRNLTVYERADDAVRK